MLINNYIIDMSTPLGSFEARSSGADCSRKYFYTSIEKPLAHQQPKEHLTEVNQGLLVDGYPRKAAGPATLLAARKLRQEKSRSPSIIGGNENLSGTNDIIRDSSNK